MARTTKKKRKMYVSVLPGEQVEVALSEDGKLQEYYVEMLHQAKTKGNIYKGVIHNVDTSLQAAFVNYGAVKNGFLQIDEVHPEYYLTPVENTKGHKYPLIQKVLKPGQEVLVQIGKEPTGAKGAFLTTYLSIPGRHLVLTPGREQIGVSRKVEDEEERARLKEIMNGITPGEGLGVIVRTVSEGLSKTNLSKDLQILERQWKETRKRGQEVQAPSLIYQEPNLAERSVRDYFTADVGEIWVDDAGTAERLAAYAAILFPRSKSLVKLHDAPDRSLWERFNLQKQIDQLYSRHVTLPSGGQLVFDQAEALMAIDINSGRTGGKTNFQETAYRTNMEAAELIPQQLRLRDVGGQIVIDFIEMKDRKQWAEVEKTLKAAMKIDRARHDVGKLNKFGLLQLVRQRLGSSAISLSSEPCPACQGTGFRRNMEWQAMQALKQIYFQLRANTGQPQLEIPLEPELCLYLLNRKKEKLLAMEQQYGIQLTLTMRHG
ncbi:Rne/Rng family ribonuclease [Megalodesulfovibrio paquesii]